MGIENATNFATLNAGNPPITDPVSEGTQHFWLIKRVIKAIFPGAGGQGYAKPITATEDDLNVLTGVAGKGSVVNWMNWMQGVDNGLLARMTNVEGTANNVASRIGPAEATIASHTNSINAVAGTANNVASRIGPVENRMGAAEAAINGHTGAINSVTGTANNVAARIGPVEARMGAAETAIGGHTTSINSHTASINDHTNRINANTTNITANTNSINAINTKIAAMHPVGSVKLTMVNVNPQTYIGGTWVAAGAGQVLMGVGTAQTRAAGTAAIPTLQVYIWKRTA